MTTTPTTDAERISRLEGAIDHMATSAAVERLEGKVDSNTERLEGKIDSNTERLEGKIDSNIERLEGKIDSNTERLEGKIDTYGARLEGALEHMATKAEVAQSEARIKDFTLKATIGLATIVIVGFSAMGAYLAFGM